MAETSALSQINHFVASSREVITELVTESWQWNPFIRVPCRATQSNQRAINSTPEHIRLHALKYPVLDRWGKIA